MRKHHSPAFKAQVVRELLKEEKSVSQLAAEYDVHPNQLYRWRDVALTGLPRLMATVETRQYVTVDALVRGVPEKVVVEWIPGERMRVSTVSEVLLELDRAELQDGMAKLSALAPGEGKMEAGA